MITIIIIKNIKCMILKVNKEVYVFYNRYLTVEKCLLKYADSKNQLLIETYFYWFICLSRYSP